MNEEVLRMALQFGNGTNLDPSKQTSIGKFGMGLPSSSVSQAKKVEVWTWQNGPESAIYCYLDIDEILNKTMVEIPKPKKNPIPKIWQDAGQNFEKKGTLVVWSNLDKCIWRTAKAIVDNSGFLVGRMYRNYLKSGKVNINLVSFHISNPKARTVVPALPNDPMYLMTNTSTPAPYDLIPLFNKWGDEKYEIPINISYRGADHVVKVRTTIAKEEARQGHNPGNRDYGKHAARNIGVSLVRADRELDLDSAYVDQGAPTERWWGMEIEFPPSLDEVFGVTNNKQFANNFSSFGKYVLDDMTDEISLAQLKEEMQIDEDPKYLMVELASQVKRKIAAMRRILKAQTKGLERVLRGHNEGSHSAELKATEATESRKQDGHLGTSDNQEDKRDEDQRKIDVQKALETDGVQNAKDITTTSFVEGYKFIFVESNIQTSAFFSVRSEGGKIIMTLNTPVVVYKKQ